MKKKNKLIMEPTPCGKIPVIQAIEEEKQTLKNKNIIKEMLKAQKLERNLIEDKNYKRKQRL